MGSPMHYFLLAKPYTLASAVLPAIVGSCLALSGGGGTSWGLWAACFSVVPLIRAGHALLSSAQDEESKAGQREHAGRSQAHEGVSPLLWHWGGVLCLAAALLLLYCTLLARGWPLALLATWCCLAGYSCSGRPQPSAKHSLMECVVVALFGAMATSAAQFLHRGERVVTADSLVAGLQVGLIAAELVALSGERTDDDSGTPRARQTRRMQRARVELQTLRLQVIFQPVLAYALGWYWLRSRRPTPALLPLATLPLAVLLSRRVLGSLPRDHASYAALAGCLHLLFGLALAAGLALG